MRRVCVIGASGKLGRYLVRHALERGHEVVGVCRERSVGKLADYADRITIVAGQTDDRDVIARAVAGCDGVLTVLVPWGGRQYSSGTATAVLDHAEPAALTDDTLVGQAPAIVGRCSPSALAHAGGSTTGPAGTGVS